MTKSVVSEARTVEPIALDHLILDGEAERGADGNYLVKSQQGWEKYFAGSGKRLPTLPEYITIIKQLDERDDSAALGSIRQDLRESALCTGTKIDYRTSNLPVGNGYLDILAKDSAWRTALQDLLKQDVEETVDLLQRTSGKRPYIWAPIADGRTAHPKRAVWLDIGADRFGLGCDGGPIYGIGRVRGVRVVGAAGAQKKEGSSVEGSVYRKPAMTEEQRLEGQIIEALSSLDKYMGTFGQDQYQLDKQQAVKELLGLYKGR